MNNETILLALLILAGVLSFGWLAVAANRASKEEREWHRKLREAAERHQEEQQENGAV